MRKRIVKYFTKNNYRKEFRHELRLLIVVTLGLQLGLHGEKQSLIFPGL